MSSSDHNPPSGDEPMLRLVGAEEESSSQTSEPSRRFAHELSNLLDGALRNLTLAMSRLDDRAVAEASPETEQRLRTANDGMRQMARLLHRWMAGGDQDPVQLYWQQSTLADALNYARKMIGPAAETAGIHIEIVADPVSLELPAGPMYPVLANALQNAVEAIGKRGWIRIRLACANSIVTLTVEDNGPGLHPDLPREPDGSAKSGATTRPNGHGIGLSVSTEILESLGGTLRLSNREHGGAVLTAVWPKPDPSKPAAFPDKNPPRA